MDEKRLKMDGERLKRERLSRGMTQLDLGLAVGVKDATISQYESGDRTPSLSVLLKMARILGCSVDYLLGRTEHRQGIVLPIEHVSKAAARYDVLPDDPRVLEIARELQRRNLSPEALDKVIDLARVLAQMERDNPAKNGKDRQN